MATAKKKAAGKKSAGKKAGAKKSAGKKAAAKKAPAKKAKRAPNPEENYTALVPSAPAPAVPDARGGDRSTKALAVHQEEQLQDARTAA
jgi:hypothetical protein